MLLPVSRFRELPLRSRAPRSSAAYPSFPAVRELAFWAVAVPAKLGLVPKISLGFGVPITAQSLGIMLCGTVRDARKGVLATLLFLLLLAIGLPLLAGGRGGLGAFVSPTAGFLFGWPVAAFITGLIVEKWRSIPVGVVASLASIIGGIGVLYFFGIVAMAIVLDKTLVKATLLMTTSVPVDIVKAVLAGVLTAALAKARPACALSRTG